MTRSFPVKARIMIEKYRSETEGIAVRREGKGFIPYASPNGMRSQGIPSI